MCFSCSLLHTPQALMPHMSLICHKKDIIYLQIQTRFEYNKFIGSTQSVPSQDFGTVNVTVTFLFVPCLETLTDLTAGFPVTGLVFTVTIISGREILLINNVHSSTTSGLHFFIRIRIETRCIGKVKISALRKIRKIK